MTLDQVIRNLENTIEGKRGMLSDLEFYTGGNGQAEQVTAEFLRVNISELERILADLKKVKEATTASSWERNPDRMGGCYTQEEIDASQRWR